MRWHWSKRAKYARQTHHSVAYAAKAARGIAPYRVPDAPLLRLLVKRKRLLDPDNLVASCKFIIDGCVKAGLIPDDNPESVTLDISQIRSVQEGVTVWICNRET